MNRSANVEQTAGYTSTVSAGDDAEVTANAPTSRASYGGNAGLVSRIARPLGRALRACGGGARASAASMADREMEERLQRFAESVRLRTVLLHSNQPSTAGSGQAATSSISLSSVYDQTRGD